MRRTSHAASACSRAGALVGRLLVELGDALLEPLELLHDLDEPVVLGLELHLDVVELADHRSELLHVGDHALLLAEVLALLAQRLGVLLQGDLLLGERLAALLRRRQRLAALARTGCAGR